MSPSPGGQTCASSAEASAPNTAVWMLRLGWHDLGSPLSLDPEGQGGLDSGGWPKLPPVSGHYTAIFSALARAELMQAWRPAPRGLRKASLPLGGVSLELVLGR